MVYYYDQEMKDLGQLEKVNVSDEDKIRVSQLLDIAKLEFKEFGRIKKDTYNTCIIITFRKAI